MNPYRQSHEAADVASSDFGLWPIATVVWIACAVRVAFVLWRGQTFGAEATLATMVVVWVGAAAVRGLLRRA